MKRKGVLGMVFIIVIILAMIFVGCDFLNPSDDVDPNGNNNGNDNGGNNGGSGNNQPGTSKDNAILVSVGYSSSHTISSSGKHWFKYTGTGDPVIIETRGNVVDTFMYIDDPEASWLFYFDTDDNSGEGSNALCSFDTISGRTYWIEIETRSGTSGTYTLVVTAPTFNIRTNPISVVEGNSSSHIINSNGTHWFKFTGNGNRIFFETESNVVNTNMLLYIGDNTSYTYSGNNGVNFITVSGQIYYISVTGNSGTYKFNVRHGTGDGTSKYNAKEVQKGYSSLHTISYGGTNWFIFQGTGEPATFETTGNIVDTYILVDDPVTSWLFYYATDDNSGEGSNALCNFETVLGRTYWIEIEARSGTSGTYTLVVN